MSVKQTARIISTYTGDTSGVCSALYELGGMTVMHDASGCNSTYNTHDEPRWYDMDSLVFISGLTEIEALMGDDHKLIGDVVTAAKELSPRFIALAGTPIPMMTGVDFQAVAMEIERETGIPTFGFSTDGMHSYISGASMAFAEAARRLCLRPEGNREESSVSAGNAGEGVVSPEDAGEGAGGAVDIQVNILGVTPLDFSVNGTDKAMRRAMEKAGFRVGAVWAMGSSFEEIRRSGEADVNLVVSACGLEAAKVLRERFGTPYVVGTPWGEKFAGKLKEAIRRAVRTGENEIVCKPCAEAEIPEGSQTQAASAGASEAGKIEKGTEKAGQKIPGTCGQTVIIGESVTALSLANALKEETGTGALVLCPVDTAPELLSDGCIQAWDEDDILPYLEGASRIIADPLYKPICPEAARFISLPHEGFSGRIFRKDIPQLVTGLEEFLKENGLLCEPELLGDRISDKACE